MFWLQFLRQKVTLKVQFMPGVKTRILVMILFSLMHWLKR